MSRFSFNQITAKHWELTDLVKGLVEADVDKVALWREPVQEYGLERSAALVREGFPLAEVLTAGARVRDHADALAELFTAVILRHAGEEALPRLRPLARSVVEAELSLALDRRLRRVQRS